MLREIDKSGTFKGGPVRNQQDLLKELAKEGSLGERGKLLGADVKGNRFLSSIHANLAASGIQADSGSAADFISSQNKKIFEDVAAIRREGRDKAQMARFNAEMAAYQSDTLADIRSYKAGQSREVAVYEIGDTILGTKYEMKRLGILGDLFEGGIFA